MREQLQQRLAELQAEYETGQKMLADLDQQRANLERTLLRISGAMQVLEEMLNQPVAAGDGLAAGTPWPEAAGRHGDEP
jgi:predicted nuclease with TOPRIM domain